MFDIGRAPKEYLIISGRTYEDQTEELNKACRRIGLPSHRVLSFDPAPSLMDAPQVVVIWAEPLEAYRRFKEYSEVFPSSHTPYVLVLPSQEELSITSGQQGGKETYLRGEASPSDVLRAMLTATGAVTAPPLTNQRRTNRQPKGKLVVVFSAKGGAGKTMVATNLACSLKEARENKVILVDGDLQMGNVADCLGFPLRTADRYLLDSVETITEQDVYHSVFCHKTSGIDVLLPPTNPAHADRVTPKAVRALAEVLRTVYDFAMIDTATYYDEKTIAWLDVADEILLVTTPDRGTIQNSLSYLAFGRGMAFDTKTSIVLNRSNTGERLAEIEEVLHQMVICSVESFGPAVVGSFDEGMPLVLKDQSHPLSKAMLELGDRLAGAPLAQRGNRFQRLLWPFNRATSSTGASTSTTSVG